MKFKCGNLVWVGIVLLFLLPVLISAQQWQLKPCGCKTKLIKMKPKREYLHIKPSRWQHGQYQFQQPIADALMKNREHNIGIPDIYKRPLQDTGPEDFKHFEEIRGGVF